MAKFLSIAFSLTAVIGVVAAADAAELKALFPGTLRYTTNEVMPQFEKSSGHKVTVVYSSAGAVAAKVGNGEAADVAITAAPQIDDLQNKGKIVAGSAATLAKVGVGVFVRKGAPKPNITSVEAFKTSLLAAKSIVYSDPAGGGPAGIYVAKLLDQLGLAAEMKPKTKLAAGGEANHTVVVNGEAEIGFNMINEIIADPRIELVGPLPQSIQGYTIFAAGLLALSTKQEAARALISFLSSPGTLAVMKKLGFEPI